MKMILTGLLLLSAVPIFAQDSLSYEELPECFFEVDQKSTHDFMNDFQREVGIDTCDKSDLLQRQGLHEWPKPLDHINSLGLVDVFFEELIDSNAIYSNQFIAINLGSQFELHNIVKPATELIDVIKISADDIKDNYSNLFAELKNKLDQIGSYEIYAYAYHKIEEGEFEPYFLAISFNKYVSFKHIEELLTTLELHIHDKVVQPPNSVIDKPSKNLQILDNNIILSDIKEAGDYTIFDIRGAQLKSGRLEIGTDNIIDISSLRAGVYFLRTPEGILKFLKEIE